MDDAVADPLDPDDPRVIGRFTVLGLLGAGGMGEVYLAASRDGYVAVKRVRPRWVSGERFKREIGLLHRVPPGVAPRVLASDSAATRPWFASEYVPGLTVSDAVRARHGPLPAPALWRLLAGTAARLRAVHEAGIVHRDLSPSNVMLLRDEVKLIDFGIARAADQDRLTRSGAGFGTSGFAAPEQEAGDGQAAPPADVYSLAAVLLYAAAGLTPGRVPDLAPVRAVDPELADVLEPCLATDPAARPTAAELSEREPVRRHAAGTDPVWPEAVLERIAAREAFAATPVGEMETLPPPQTGAGADQEQEQGLEERRGQGQDPGAGLGAVADPRARTHAPGRAGSIGGAGTGPVPGPTAEDGPEPGPRGRRRGLLLLPVAAVLVTAGVVIALMLTPKTSKTPSANPGGSTATAVEIGRVGATAPTSGAAGRSRAASASAGASPSSGPSSGATGPAGLPAPSNPAGAQLGGGGASTTSRAASTAAGAPGGGADPTATSIQGVNGSDDPQQVPGSEADTYWVGNDATCSAWLDDGGNGTLAGVLNTSLTQSCVAELFRSDGMAYTFSASWGAEKTNFISDTGDTMWICVWHADDQAGDEECSARFAMNGDAPVKQ